MKKNTAANIRLKKLVISALMLALALVLPFLTGQIQQIGNMLCPMHFPVLLCGFICGWQWGLCVGAVAPLLRSLLFSMPPMYPVAAAMALELAAYGLAAGLLYKLLPKKYPLLYVELVISMVFGRLIWGAARLAFAGLDGTAFPFAVFWAGAVADAIPGIILQLVIIPQIIFALKKSGLSPEHKS